jgi:hypothetical protein
MSGWWCCCIRMVDGVDGGWWMVNDELLNQTTGWKDFWHARRLEGSADIDVCSFIYAHDVIHILNNMNTFGPLTPTVLARPNELDSWSHDTADCHKRIAIKQHWWASSLFIELTNEVNWNDIKWHDMRWDKMNDIKSSEMSWNVMDWIHEHTTEWPFECMNEWMNEVKWHEMKSNQTKWMQWMGEYIDEWMNGWMDERMNL